MKYLLTAMMSLVLLHPLIGQVEPDYRKGKTKEKTITPKGYPGANHLKSQVIVYDQPGFSGNSKSFGIGAYRFTSAADMNDAISSIKVSDGLIALIYEHANSSGGFGNYTDLMEDCPDLSTYKFDDKISYLLILSADSRRGFLYARARKVDDQFIERHWERSRANGTIPDNSPPAVFSYMAATAEIVKPVVDESQPVYRIELRIITGSDENDNTDAEVIVTMTDNRPEYFLDYGRNDFEKGADERFDVIGYGLSTLKEIKFIRIGIKGNDAWGVKRIDLYLNNSPAPVFRKTFENPYRINGEGDYAREIFIGTEEMRANDYWEAIPQNTALKTLPAPLPYTMIKSMVESMVGNQLHYQEDRKLGWGNTSGVNTVWGDHVEMQRIDGNTLHFDLDLEYETTGINPEIDIDFDMVFSCFGTIEIRTGNLRLGCEVMGVLSCESLKKWLNGFLYMLGYDRIVTPDTEGKLFSQVFRLNSSSVNCKGVLVNPNGDVFIY